MPKKVKRNQDGEPDDEDDAFREEDLSDDSDARRRRRNRKGRHDQRNLLVTDQFVPGSMKRLRACVFCKLVLNQDKWRKHESCPNCPDSRGLPDTTDCFESVLSLILPRKSWVAEWQKMQDLIPGMYAMAVHAPDDEEDLDEDDDFVAK